MLLSPVSVPGPTALIPKLASADDLPLALKLVCAFSRYDKFADDITVRVANGSLAHDVSVPRPYDRAPLLPFQLL